jgi:predicted RNA-binding protein associated with RNAse of E/G family
VEVAGLRFEPGDQIREFFSPRHPFNVFGVHAPGGAFRGWYGNVTRTARLAHEEDALVLTWPDLVLDVVMLPDGSVSLLDDDELQASGLLSREPDLARQIVAAREELQRLLEAGFFPQG